MVRIITKYDQVKHEMAEQAKPSLEFSIKEPFQGI